MFRPISRVVLMLLAAVAARECAAQRYNPYADGHEVLAPVAPDGTLQWGTFFKSAQMQRTYERLWSIGACRGTNRAITEPVENNRLVIDRLPEADFEGVVQGAGGALAGGVVAFRDKGAGGNEPPLFAQLHPAGVSHVTVTGKIALPQVRPGMMVRLRAQVDERGRGGEPIRRLEVVTVPTGYKPDAVEAGRIETIIGSVVSLHGRALVVRVDAGRLRRLAFAVDADAVVTVDGACLELVSPGDAVAVKGRLWSGAGAAGGGTIFASHVTVTKQAAPQPEQRAMAAGAGAGAGRPVE